MKFFFDYCIALLAIVVLSPLLILISILVLFNLGTPIFFRQWRPGLNGKPFQLIKFRSMRDLAGPDAPPLSDSIRLSSFGKFLRASSLDELPELLNVLRGEMSLVGPRPLLMEYLPLYNEYQARRHCVRPGITGWAQVNGRNAISWDERFDLDIWYVNNQTFGLDLKILIITIVRVFQRSGISQAGEATMTKFKGSNRSHG